MVSRKQRALIGTMKCRIIAFTGSPRTTYVAACVCAALLLFASPAASKPFTYGAGVAPLKWPDNKTINIYIESDPDADPPDVSALLKEGMDRWAAEMTPRGITINVTVGAVPDPEPANLVKSQYKPVGSKLDGDDADNPDHPALGDENLGIAGLSGGTQITGGQIIFRDDLWDAAPGNNDDAKKEFIRNLGQHEVTHILGLADDVDGEVTNHTQDTSPNSYNDEDKSEISSLYPILEPEPEEDSKAEGATQQSEDPDRYDWNFTYSGPPNGHVALITLDIDPAVVGDLICPAGWECLNPADPARFDPSHPYYQNYMTGARTTRWIWDDDIVPPLALRAASAGAALSVENPQLTLTLFAVNHTPGPINVWAGGGVQSLEGPMPLGTNIPTVSEWGLIIMVLLSLTVGTIIFARRRRPTLA